jgi:hypothetical protein
MTAKYSLSILFVLIMAHHDCNAQTWSALGSGTNGSRVNTILIDSTGMLYAGGDFFKAGGVIADGIAKWDGTSWSPVGTGMDGQVFVLKIINGSLYAGGEFFTAGGQEVHCIAKWDGTSWSSLGKGMLKTGGHTFTTSVRDIALYQGELYAAGVFDYADGKDASHIAHWTGSTWEPVGEGISGDYINTLEVYNNELYAGGSFNSADGISARNIAKWNGTSWSAVAQGFNNVVNDLHVHNGGLYAAGSFTATGSGAGILKYIALLMEEEGWVSLLNTTNDNVTTLATMNGRLLAGGYFTQAGGETVNRIAILDGFQWQPLNTGMDNAVKVIFFDSSANRIYAGGSFIKAGGVTVNHIAAIQLVTDVKENFKNLPQLTIYPQPAGAHGLTFTLPESITGKNYSIRIINILGQTVFENNLISNSVTITKRELPSGIYMYAIMEKEKKIHSGIITF